MKLLEIELSVLPPGEALAGEGTGEDEGFDPFRVCGREDDCGWSALAHPDQRRVLAPGRVHDRFDLQGTFLDRPDLRNWVGETNPGLVEQHHSTDGADPVEKRLRFRQRPDQLDVTHERAGDDEVNVAFAEHLIRQADVAALRVSGIRHPPSLRPYLF